MLTTIWYCTSESIILLFLYYFILFRIYEICFNTVRWCKKKSQNSYFLRRANLFYMTASITVYIARKPFKQKRVCLMKCSLHVNYHYNKGFLSRLSCFNSNLINPAGGTFLNKAGCLATYLSFFINRTKSFDAVLQTIRIKRKWTQFKACSYFHEIERKWLVIPGATTKCPRMALKYTIPKKLWASGPNVVRYITHSKRSKLQRVILRGLPAVSPAKLNFMPCVLISARRCDQKEPYCHNRRRRCSWYMESGEAQIFRSISRHQLFPCQDLGMLFVSLCRVCLWIPLGVEFKRFIKFFDWFSRLFACRS